MKIASDLEEWEEAFRLVSANYQEAGYEATTGKQLYTQRLPGSNGYTASPVAADGRIYFTSEEGFVRVIKAGPKYEYLASNPLGDLHAAYDDGRLTLEDFDEKKSELTDQIALRMASESS